MSHPCRRAARQPRRRPLAARGDRGHPGPDAPPSTAVVAVDTGSQDESADLLDGGVRRRPASAPGATGFPAAVELGLERLRRAGRPDREWVWLLHDDTNPDPGALERCSPPRPSTRTPTSSAPSCASGPRCGGCSSSASRSPAPAAARPGSSAASTTRASTTTSARCSPSTPPGMLVRRAVLEELGGFDEQLPIFGNDIDFGWRAAAAGHSTIVVPDGGRLPRRGRAPRRPPDPADRPAHALPGAPGGALHAAGQRPAGALPFQAGPAGVRHRCSGWSGFLLVRSVGEALDELAALAVALLQPGPAPRRPPGAAAARSATAEPRRACAACSRRGGCPTGTASTSSATWPPPPPTRPPTSPSGAGPRPPSATRRRWPRRSPPTQRPRRRRRSTSRTPALVGPVPHQPGRRAARAVRGRSRWSAPATAFGAVAGGALSPVPDAVGDWWRLHLESWHPLGAGHRRPGAAVRRCRSRCSRSLLGTDRRRCRRCWSLAVPLALWGAWRFLRVVGPAGEPARCAAVAAAVGRGDVRPGPGRRRRLGRGPVRPVVVAAALLPWLAHAALGFADPEADRRWRAAWRSGLLLALVTAFAPVAWLFAPGRSASSWSAPRRRIVPRRDPRPLGVGTAGGRARRGAGAARARGGCRPCSAAPARALLLDVGRLPTPVVDGLDLLTGRFGDAGAPVVARAGARRAGAARAGAAARPGSRSWSAGSSPPSPRCSPRCSACVSPRARRDRQPAGLGLPAWSSSRPRCSSPRCSARPRLDPRRSGRGVAAGGRGRGRWPPCGPGRPGWSGSGSAGRRARRTARHRHPGVHGAERETGAGARHPRDPRQRRRRPHLHASGGATASPLGEDEILGADRRGRRVHRRWSATWRRGRRPTRSTALADRGIEYVVLPAPADGDGRGRARRDRRAGPGQRRDRGTRAWQVARDLDPDAVDGPAVWLRIVLLVLQGLAIVVGARALRCRRRERRRS